MPSSTRPNNSQARFRNYNVPGTFPTGTPLQCSPVCQLASVLRNIPGHVPFITVKAGWWIHEDWLFGEALETLQSVTKDPKMKSLPMSICAPSTPAKTFNFYSFVILGHRELCVHSSQSFLPARDRAPRELCPEHIYAKKKYF